MRALLPSQSCVVQLLLLVLCFESVRTNCLTAAPYTMPSGPKTNKYTNRHTAEAQQRDQERAQESKQARQKAKEDAEWELTDKQELKRAEKMKEMAEKEADRNRREAEKREQLEMEERSATNKVPTKVSKRELQKQLSKMCSDYDKERDSIRGTVPDEPREEEKLVEGNQNRRHAELPSSNHNSANATEIEFNDRNIGKRARVLYRAFYNEQLEKVKEEQPGLRRTQYHNVIWDMWQKSSSNPFAQRKEKAFAERLEAERAWIMGEGEDDDDAEEVAE